MKKLYKITASAAIFLLLPSLSLAQETDTSAPLLYQPKEGAAPASAEGEKLSEAPAEPIKTADPTKPPMPEVIQEVRPPMPEIISEKEAEELRGVESEYKDPYSDNSIPPIGALNFTLGMPIIGQDIKPVGAQFTLDFQTFITQGFFAHFSIGMGGFGTKLDIKDSNDETKMVMNYTVGYLKLAIGGGYTFWAHDRFYVQLGALGGFRFIAYWAFEDKGYEAPYTFYNYSTTGMEINGGTRAPFIEPYASFNLKLSRRVYWGFNLSYIVSPNLTVKTPKFSYFSDAGLVEGKIHSHYLMAFVSLNILFK